MMFQISTHLRMKACDFLLITEILICYSYFCSFTKLLLSSGAEHAMDFMNVLTRRTTLSENCECLNTAQNFERMLGKENLTEEEN